MARPSLSPFAFKPTAVGFAAVLFFCALLPAPAASSRAVLSKPADITPDVSLPDEAVSVRKEVFDVTIGDGSHHNMAVFVYELSALDGGREAHVSKDCKKNQDVALVLFHGATYNHKYWDTPFSVDNSPHSLARYLAKECYFVLAADILLGTGESDKPDGFAVGVPDQAHASADFLRAIQSNHNAAREHKAKKVVVVGHSFGSIMSDLILGTTPGIADGFVATGWTNGYEPNLPHFEDVFNAIDQPPNTVPYITLPTGGPPFGVNLRSGFYDGVDLATFQAPNPHPTWSDVMVTYDSTSLADNITHKNAFLDTVPLLDNRRKNAANAPDYIFNTFHTDQITCPVFMLCGESDIFANAAGCATGGGYYPNSVSVTSFVQPNIGHVYNQHKTCVPGWEKIVDFVKSVA